MDKVICVGKNYVKHAQELGEGVPDEPLYFLKPPSTICVIDGSEGQIELPKTGEIHYELELALKISEGTNGLQFTHFTFGLDLTIRDLQTRLKKAGQPWEKAKVFRNSSVLGSFHPIFSLEDVLELPFELEVNGKLKQRGVGRDMRWRPDFLLADVQKWFPVVSGDILFTGTPEGVGPIRAGDELNVSGGPVQYSVRCT